MNLETAIDLACEKLDLVTDDTEKKIIQAEIFDLIEQLNGNTIHLTLQQWNLDQYFATRLF